MEHLLRIVEHLCLTSDDLIQEAECIEEHGENQYPDLFGYSPEDLRKAAKLLVQQEPKITCPVCGKEFVRSDMEFSYDCHGIPFRLLCLECKAKIEEEKGYDGEYYTEADECLDY